MTSPGIVIVGAGQAAAVAAQSLRGHGYRGPITMVGREPHKPYERPPLSKAVLVEAEEPRLDVLPGEAWTQLDVDLLAGSDAVALDVARRQVRLASGQVLRYEQCLLATGGEPRTIAILPSGYGRVHHLRTLDDARRLRTSLQRRPRVVVLGGGFLGLEVAHSALAAGATVTVLERAGALLDRFVPPEVSAWLAAELRAAGAQLLLDDALAQAQPCTGGSVLLATQAGAMLEADEVVVAVGLAPNDSLARDAGLAIAPGGGVLVDAACRTSDERVFACGDCASQQRAGQAAPARMESWQNANEQARCAAAAMAGAPRPEPVVPWFWTDQGQHNVQILGAPAADLVYVRRGSPAQGKALWIGHRRHVPVHAIAINAGADLRAVRPLLERAARIDPQAFQQEDVNLRAWARQQQAEAAAAT